MKEKGEDLTCNICILHANLFTKISMMLYEPSCKPLFIVFGEFTLCPQLLKDSIIILEDVHSNWSNRR